MCDRKLPVKRKKKHTGKNPSLTFEELELELSRGEIINFCESKDGNYEFSSHLILTLDIEI